MDAVSNQYSASVAAAQEALKIDDIYQTIFNLLLKNAHPEALRNIGLVYAKNRGGIELSVSLHGQALVGRYDQVWFQGGNLYGKLGGRIQFCQLMRDGNEGETVLEVVFDSLGNAQVLTTPGVLNASADQEQPQFVRAVSLALANAVHSKMDKVSAS